MRRIESWVRGLSVRLQVSIGIALWVALATLAFALLITYTSRQSIKTAEEERLRQTQMMASSLDAVLRRSNDGLGRIPEILSVLNSSGTLASSVVDSNGNVLVTGLGEGVGVDPHFPLLADLIQERRAGVRLHRIGGSTHIVAFAPMDLVDGGVVAEEVADRLLAAPFWLLRILPFFGLGLLVVASLSAWLHARYVARDLAQLEKAMARVASGTVDEPITTTRRDEIGRLAQSFEAMRSQLKAASQARDLWERELELRVRERTAEVHRLVGRVIHAQEEERRRLAQELHDDTAQALASLLMGIEALRDAVPPDQRRVRQHIDRAISEGSHALEDLRRVILGLRPAAIGDLGLVAALRSYASARLVPSGAHLDFAVQGKEQTLPEAVEAALFRILQEAVNNIARHAGAQHARVCIDFQDTSLVVTVEDDGQGFDPAQVQALSRGLGLKGMRERAEVINARLEMTSATGKGTRVRVELPLKEAKDE